MSVFKTAREDFKAKLEELGLRVYTYEEDNPKPPCAIVIPADPYYRPLGGEKTMSAYWTIGLNIVLIGQKGTKPAHTDFLDDALERVILAVEPFGSISPISRPGSVELSDGEYFGVVIEFEYNPPREN